MSATHHFEVHLVPEYVGQMLYLHEVNRLLLLPVGVTVLIVLASHDVIHSLGIQPLAVKSDAVPGKLNAANTQVALKGCSVPAAGHFHDAPRTP